MEVMHRNDNLTKQNIPLLALFRPLRTQMTTMAAIMTRMAAAAGTTRFKFINMASNGFSLSDDSLAGAIVAEKIKK
jgi:hypothetical protein